MCVVGQPKDISGDNFACPDNTSMTSDGHFQLEWITEPTQIESHVDQWRDLESNCSNPFTAFQSYGWCRSWAQAYCASQNAPLPRMLMIMRDGTLVAILPLMITNSRGIKTLTLFGEPHTQVANLMVRDGFDCNKHIKRALHARADQEQIDIIALGPIPAYSPLHEALKEEKLNEDPAQYFSIVKWSPNDTPSDYLLKLSKNRRKDFGKKLRRLETMGEVTFDRCYQENEAYTQLIKKALEWKRQWLVKTKTISVGLQRNGVEQFLSNIRDTPNGYRLEAEALRVDGEPIAITLNIIGKGMRSCYLTAYDDTFTSISPGTLVHQHAIQSSITDQIEAYNFLGFPTHFKKMWMTDEVPLLRYQNARSLRGKLWTTLWTNFARPLVKRAVNSTGGLSKIPIVGMFIDGCMKLLFKQGNKG